MENVQRILPWIRFLWNNENRCFHLESNMSLLYIKTTDNQWSFHASSGKGKCKLISPFSLLMSYIHSWKRCRKKTEWRITNLRKSFWKFWLLFNKHQFNNMSWVHKRPHPNQWNQWESSQLASAGLSQQKCNYKCTFFSSLSEITF